MGHIPKPVPKVKPKGEIMARIRTIKPEFFKNEVLSDLKFEARLLFIGLWTIADREGRLEDRPKRIKGEIFPYENVNVEKALVVLEEKGLITRYSATVANKAEKLIQINTFSKHQRPHIKEVPSTYPAPTLVVPSTLGREGNGKEGNGEQEGKGNETPPSGEIPTSTKDEKKEEPPIAADPPLKRIGDPKEVPPENDTAVRELEFCDQIYFMPLYSQTRMVICSTRKLTEEQLRDWVQAFNRHLVSEGCRGKPMNDYVSHFSRWQNIQISKGIRNPKELYNEQGNSNNKRGGPATGANVSTVQAFNTIDAMYAKDGSG